MRLLPVYCAIGFTLAACPAFADGGAPVRFALEPGGAIRVTTGSAAWTVTSAFSFPGEKIGWNRLAPANADAGWKVQTRAEDGQPLRVEARGEHYSLLRTIRIAGNRARVSDQIANVGSTDVGILAEHTLAGDQPPEELLLCGASIDAAIAAENPTLFARQKSGALGLFAEDDVFRSQFHATRKDGVATMGMRHLGLKPGATMTLEWSIDAFDGRANYFDWINLLRRDLGASHRLIGPSDWLDVTRPEARELLGHPDKLKAWLGRTGYKMLLLVPWLDYDNINRLTDKPTTREEYRRFMKEAMTQLKAIDPEIKLLGCIEGPFVSLPRDLVDTLVDLIPTPRQTGYHEMTDDMLAAFRANTDAWKRWGDSVVWARGGKAHYEYYRRGGKQQIEMLALTVRPVLGNGQHQYLMDQARFIIEDVGLDGFYVDSFTGAQHWHYGYSYDKWDGVTVDIDATTGRIADRYTDLALAGAGSRRDLIQYGLTRGKLVVLNGHPIDRETQSLAAMYFNESEWVFEPLKWMEGEPPLEQRPCEGHLSSPIALGFRPGRSGDEGTRRYAEIIMKGAIAYLRHGITYFHYQTAIPEDGPGSGEYGVFQHMFPVTPTRLGEGFVEGPERTITCISGRYDRPGTSEPRILLFDLSGRPVQHDIKAVKSAGGWQIDLKLPNWRSIAVIE